MTEAFQLLREIVLKILSVHIIWMVPDWQELRPVYSEFVHQFVEVSWTLSIQCLFVGELAT